MYAVTGWIPGKTDAKALFGLLTSSWLNLMLLVVPVGWICHFCHVNSIVVFVLVSLLPCWPVTLQADTLSLGSW